MHLEFLDITLTQLLKAEETNTPFIDSQQKKKSKLEHVHQDK